MNDLKPQISSITRGPRQTNMELLRILAMFMVVMIHADFVSLGGAPTRPSGLDAWVNSLTRTWIDMIGIVAVNVFVLISGWFGIKASVRGVCNFLFQVFVILLFAVSVKILLLPPPFNVLEAKNLASILCFTTDLWFVKAYLGLYLLAPVLNMFCEKGGRIFHRNVLVLFFAYQTFWGWIGNNMSVDGGYSVLSFIGLYLLARYMRLYCNTAGKQRWLWLYLVMSVAATANYYLIPQNGIASINYCNPIIIVEAVALLLLFTNLKVPQSKAINYLASSCFAVYLFHNSNSIFPFFQHVNLEVYETTHGVVTLLAMGGVVLTFFVVAVILDQPRKWLWNRLGGGICRLVERMYNSTLRILKIA